MLKEDKEATKKLSAIVAAAVIMAKPGSILTSQPFCTGESVGDLSQSESQQKTC